MININILLDLYYWVTNPLNENNIENDVLKNKILEYYGCLPEQINNYEVSIDYPYDGFIRDMFNNVEYSNELKFKLLNNGRKYLLKSLKVVLFFFIPSLILPLFSRLLPLNNYIYMFIIAGVLLIGSIISLLINKITPKILETMKPGDLLKILNADDENFPITRAERSFGPNEYENVTVVESKKRYTCQKYRELIETKRNKNLYNLMVYYIATDYLVNTENNEEIITEYRKQITQTLEYIMAFKQDSLYILFNLAHNELNLLNLDNSLKYFNDYYKLFENNINVNAWIIVLNFVNENEMKPQPSL